MENGGHRGARSSEATDLDLDLSFVTQDLYGQRQVAWVSPGLGFICKVDVPHCRVSRGRGEVKWTTGT